MMKFTGAAMLSITDQLKAAPQKDPKHIPRKEHEYCTFLKGHGKVERLHSGARVYHG